MAPRVSVIVPTHNRPELLAEALESIARQTFQDWEALVIDDASTPKIELPHLISICDRVSLTRHDTSRGGSASKNSGIATAAGELLAFLDDDDLYTPQYLATAARVLDQHPEIDVLFMGVGWFGRAAEYGERTHTESTRLTLADAKGEMIAPNLWRFGQPLLYALLRRVPMPFQRPVVRRAALEKIGLYRPECLLWDCEWALRAALTCRCALLNEPLYLQRVDGQGTSSRGDREYDHLVSGFEMISNLMLQPPIPLTAEVRDLLRDAASRSAANLAYYHSRHGQVKSCLRACWTSQRLRPSLARLKIPVAAVACALGIRGHT